MFALARIPERWGYARDGRGPLLTRRVRIRKSDEPVHMVRYYTDLMEGLGIPAPLPDIRLSVTEEEAARGRDLLAEAGLDPRRPLIVLSPGAAYGPAKRWAPERFSALARILQGTSWSRNRRHRNRGRSFRRRDHAPASSRPAADLTGKTTLRDSSESIQAAAVFVTNDSGPMHHGQ